jgi:serine/threonine-protein kinase
MASPLRPVDPDGQVGPETVPLAEPPTGAHELPPTGAERQEYTPDVTVDSPGTAIDDSRRPDPAMALGRYELLGELAAGGMGVVYRARDTELGRTVALKMMRAGMLAGPEEVQRFVREARAAAGLNHPHIVPIYEIGQHDGRYYFTMALAGGGSLAQHLHEVSENPRTAVLLFQKIAAAVAHAHGKGVLHRDLKPANVLLDDRGEPLVSDFGLAKLLEEGDDLTRTGELLGTPAYMAPEQAAGKVSQIDVRSDVWSLGVLLYELLTGRRPFVGESREDVRQQVLHGEPPRPRSLRPALPRDLEAIVLRCLEKDAGRRYPTVAALSDDLGRWLHGQPLEWSGTGLRSRLARAVRRRPWWGMAAAVALAAAVGLPAALYVAETRRPEQKIDRDLRAGQAVTLIGGSGKPAWSHWLAGEDAATVSTDADGTFTLHTWTASLLELVPHPPPGAYAFRAEVRHRHADEGGEVGLFCGHRALASRRGWVHTFLQCSYNDVFDVAQFYAERKPPPGVKLVVPPGNALWFGARLYDQNRTNDTTGARIGLGQPVYFRPGGVRGSPWRRLRLEVTAAAVQVQWENEKSYEVPADRMVEQTAQQVADSPWAGLHPTLDSEGSLGLYLYRGSASFRNVVVEPLHAP